MKRSTKILLFRLFLFVLLLAAAAIPAYYFYNKYQSSQKLLANPSVAAENELQSVISSVSKLIDLPHGEMPTLATVSDKDLLKNEPFFKNSENGDKVLVYAKARKAYLYRPSTNKLIDVTSLSQTSNLMSKPSTTQAKKENEVDIVLSNGTGISSLLKTVESQISTAMPSSHIIERRSASSSGHLITKVIVLNSKKQQVALELAKGIKASLAPMPTYEVRPTSGDILVIIGKDKAPAPTQPVAVTPTPVQ